MEQAEPLGIIGLGLLGGALASRALAKGFGVLGYDIEPSRRAELERVGGKAAEASKDVARVCRCIFLVLPHIGVSREVLREIAPVTRPRSILLDATTGDPESAVAIAGELMEDGIDYLDATVSGSSQQVARGDALFIVGGAEETYRECHEMLEALAGNSVYAGPSGNGAKMKLVTNLVLGLNRAALAEGLAYAKALGLDLVSALEVLKSSSAYSKMMDTKGEKMVHADFRPQARLSQHLKDVRLMIESAARAGQRLPLTEAHREILERAEQMGLGELDNSALLRAIESERRAEGEE